MNHFHFPSAKSQETGNFYEQFFGFRRVRCIGKTQVLIGRQGFVLAIDESPEGAPLGKGSHLGFALDSPLEVIDLFRTMQACGIPMCSELLEPSDRVTHYYCEDPSGNKVEVGWYQL